MAVKVNLLNKWINSTVSRIAPTLLRLQHSRPLTLGEKSLVYSIFYDQLDLDLPRIYASGWVIKGYAISPNGHVYFNPSDYMDDFSVASLGKQAWLIHEMTHVWQIQQGMKVVRRALIDRRYQYLLKQGKSFFTYGIEQQAQMVQDFFVRRSLGKDCRELEQCIPFFNQANR